MWGKIIVQTLLFEFEKMMRRRAVRTNSEKTFSEKTFCGRVDVQNILQSTSSSGRNLLWKNKNRRNYSATLLDRAVASSVKPHLKPFLHPHILPSHPPRPHVHSPIPPPTYCDRHPYYSSSQTAVASPQTTRPQPSSSTHILRPASLLLFLHPHRRHVASPPHVHSPIPPHYIVWPYSCSTHILRSGRVFPAPHVHGPSPTSRMRFGGQGFRQPSACPTLDLPHQY